MQGQLQANPAFSFVRELAVELSAGHVELPSFPDVAVQIRRILSDPNSSVDQVVRVVGSEPALAARLMRIANSASLNRSGRPVSDLRTAINRIGYNMVRSASMSFAMQQIRDSSKLQGIASLLHELWERSTCVAAYSFVLARSHPRINPDVALLTGMMHAIGKLYILTRAAGHPEFFADAASMHEIIDGWHASIGKAILENWDFPDSMSQAVGDQADVSRVRAGGADLGDIIGIATLIASYGTDIAGLEAALRKVAAAQRVGLDQNTMMTLMQDSAAEVTALRQALGA